MAPVEPGKTLPEPADPTRSSILAFPCHGEETVNELAVPFAVSRPAVQPSTGPRVLEPAEPLSLERNTSGIRHD